MNDKILCYIINIIYGSWSYSVINIRYSSRFNLIKISDETNTKYKVPIRIMNKYYSNNNVQNQL